ncbi:MAG: hypothetical protein WCP96_15540 [Methylococcaceae bacterium]
MKIKLLLACLSLGCTLATAAPAASKVPKPLAAQVQRLVALLSDGYAVGYPGATRFQTIKHDVGGEIALVVFTIENFGGGNNYSQFFAVFSPETTGKGKQHFMLLDVMKIGRPGWRAIEKLNVKTTPNPTSDETIIAIDALENTAEDSFNFPSKKITINLVLKNGRLSEQKTP